MNASAIRQGRARPRHRVRRRQDIANTALFLATEPGKHISGQAISVCGGARYLV